MVLAPDQQSFICGFSNNSIIAYDTHDYSAITQMRLDGPIVSLCYSTDDTVLVGVAGRHSVCINVNKGLFVACLDKHLQPVSIIVNPPVKIKGKAYLYIFFSSI